MADYPTPHIDAVPEDFAETVLMPGDPLRAKFIAENFLENARLVNSVRGINGYTGEYKGKTVSVMASGMGMPSIGIYSYELFNLFGVENIIRIGSAGSYNESVKVRDIVIAEGACTDSNYAGQFGLPGTFAPTADFGILRKTVETAEKMGIRHHVGSVLSSDRFYTDTSLPASMRPPECWAKMGVLCVEMEAAALFMNAAAAGKHAAAVFTISDSLITGEKTTAEERQNSFTDMMKLALETTLLL